MKHLYTYIVVGVLCIAGFLGGVYSTKVQKKNISDKEAQAYIQQLYAEVEQLNSVNNTEHVKEVPMYIKQEDNAYFIDYTSFIKHYKFSNDLVQYLQICNLTQRRIDTVTHYYEILSKSKNFIEKNKKSKYTDYCMSIIKMYSKDYFGLGDQFYSGDTWSQQALEQYRKIANNQDTGTMHKLTQEFYQTILQNKGERNANTLAKGIQLVKETE